MANEYIRRENALYAIQRQRGATRSPAQNRLLDSIRADIARVPAADVAEVAHAKWILDRYPDLPARECSRCTIMIPRMKQVPEQFWQYCPNCGARMDGETE
jgi:hypothetical protein|nr:MAG TPA: TFIIB zinc-binding [Caudoviricetes sp.]